MKLLCNPSILHQKPSAVLFDLDHTLYDYEPAHSHALSITARKFKQHTSLSESVFMLHYEQARDKVKVQLQDQASAHSRLLYFQNLLESLGLQTQMVLTLDLEQTYWRSFLSQCRLFNGVHELLEELRILNIKRVIVTDLTAQIQLKKLIYLELDSDIDYLVTSEESGHDKPHPASFLLAQQKIATHDLKGPLWMIGDSLNKDIKGAKEALSAITFYRQNSQDNHASHNMLEFKKHVDVLFSRFDDITELLHRHFSEENTHTKHPIRAKA